MKKKKWKWIPGNQIAIEKKQKAANLFVYNI
jgi:hypothetical protein